MVHPDAKGHCNSYGFLGGLSAIAVAVSTYLTTHKGCPNDDINYFHSVSLIGGIVVCVCAIFAIATLLNNMTPVLLYVAAVAIAGVAVCAGYAAYLSFSAVCGLSGFTSKNIFEDKNGPMIGVFFLDILACIMLLSAAGNVARRAM